MGKRWTPVTAKYPTPELFRVKTDEYFALRDMEGKTYSLRGLWRHLGISPITFWFYENRVDTHEIAMYARRKVAEKPTGAKPVRTYPLREPSYPGMKITGY